MSSEQENKRVSRSVDKGQLFPLNGHYYYNLNLMLHTMLTKTRTFAVSDSYPTIVHYKADARVRCVVEIAQLGKTF